ncbi:hypothetical protein [Actinoplanes sp. NPDC020271]|uniref:hypothetical protein n=1 Tax=Actinoplanes sp. NPDC020271 TaxID=3363896 RepID=UPI00378AD250
MQETLTPWWTEVQDAAQLLASQLNAVVAHAAQVGTYTPPPGSPPPRRRRQPASLRHLAEVIRTHRLAPGLSVDKDDIAAVLSGDPRRITEPVLVVAVARAAHLIAGAPFDQLDADRLVVAGTHVAALVDAARKADEQAPRTVPEPSPEPSTEVERPAREPVVIDAYFTTRRPGRRRALIAGALGLILVAVAATVVIVGNRDPGDRPETTSPPVDVPGAVVPLDHGHAGTAFRSTRPLQDALDRGYTGVEAQVMLRNGNLLLCSGSDCGDRLFPATYLQGLNARVSAAGGRVYPGYHQPVLLFVAIGCVTDGDSCRLPADPAEAAADENNPLVVARQVMSALTPYRGMLFHVDGSGRHWGPVQVVVTGSHNDEQVPAGAGRHDSVRGLLSRQGDTYAFLDGSFGVDRDLYDADLVPVISFPDPAFGSDCTYHKEDSIEEVHWDDIVTAQTTGHHVRVTHPAACPEREDSWSDAINGGVDYISAGELEPLSTWLGSNAVGGGGGNCAVPAWIAAQRVNGQFCTLVTGDVPVMSGPDPLSERVGSLAKGGAHWFVGQQPGRPVTRAAATNFWWAYTRADNGRWGWVSLAYFTNPGRDQPADGLQYACYDVRPDQPDICHPL